MKIAIVHYWMTNMGGGERVLLELHKLYPDAPIYTSVYDRKALPEFKNADVRTTWLQNLPFRFKHQFFAVLRPFAFRSLDLSEFDIVISSDAADAKNVRVKEGGLHICYCHTPIRYFWSDYEKYLKNPGFGRLDPVVRIGLKVLVYPLRKIDFKAAQRVDYFIANSKHIKKRIKKYYQCDSEVIFPPVDTERFKPSGKIKKHGFVHIGRMVPLKRIDLIIAACNELRLPLTVAGRGSEYQKLKAMAGSSVNVIWSPSNQEVTKLFQESEAFIFAAEEDFGITPVEAMSAGTPVIAFGKAGVLESVVPGVSGEFFNEQTVASLILTLNKFEPSKYKQKDLLEQASKFSQDTFSLQIKEFINSKTL